MQKLAVTLYSFSTSDVWTCLRTETACTVQGVQDKRWTVNYRLDDKKQTIMIQLQLFNGLHVARLLACTQRQAIVGLDMGRLQAQATAMCSAAGKFVFV